MNLTHELGGKVRLEDGRHLVQLDGLRAIAVILVIAEHNSGASRRTGVGWGTLGVWLFYLLSGFLITGILLRARQRAEGLGASRLRVWIAFWARRALRILPLYYVALFVTVALGLGAARSEWPWLVTFLENASIARMGEWPPAISHFWSLAVEEQFYLLWPLACLWLTRLQFYRVAVACVVLAPLLRVALVRATLNGQTAFCWMPCCLDGLALGAVLAIKGRAPRTRVFLAGAALVLVTAVAVQLRMGWSLNGSVQRLGFALIAWRVVGRAAAGFTGAAGRLLSATPMVELGKISYGVYVIHGFLPELVETLAKAVNSSVTLPAPGLARVAVVLAGSWILAWGSWHWLERPINGLKTLFPYVSNEPLKVTLGFRRLATTRGRLFPSMPSLHSQETEALVGIAAQRHRD